MNIYRRFKQLFNVGEKISKFEDDIQEGKRCKSCYEVIRDKTKWYKGPILCQGCQDAIDFGIAWH